MDVTRIADARRYETVGHFDMVGLRLLGAPATVTSGTTVSLSYFLPGGGAERSASNTEKFYVVLEGEVTIVTDAGEATLGRLDSCCLAPGEARSVVNRGNTVATMLVIVNPKAAS
jgi:uncharacterized cupin superfamily protein